MENNEKIAATQCYHLPIIKAFAKQIDLVNMIDRMVESKMEIPIGTVVLGMVLDTLSGRTPLYRLAEFYEDKDTELILGESVSSQAFADHNLRRAADVIYAAGTLKIFSALSANAIKIFDVDMSHVHFDTTSVSVWGDYDLVNPPFDITYGYSKDKRPDLKQFLISMLCVDRNIPIFGKPEDGNGSDKSINNTILSNISKHMAEHGLEDGAFVYVADSALITESNLKLMEDGGRFLSRLPANYKECRRVIREAVMADEWEPIGLLNQTGSTAKRPPASYQAHESKVTLYDREYRAIVIHSSAHDKRRHKRIDRILSDERKELEQIGKKLGSDPFFCRADAEAAATKLSQSGRYHQVSVEIKEVPKYGRGRPPQNKPRTPLRFEYFVDARVEEKPDKVADLRTEAGCFVLITDLDSLEEMENGTAADLSGLYKSQDGIEKNFGFLKDPVIVNSIFLKKAERIEVLGLILLIALLIWRLIERSLRQYVQQSKTRLPGWAKRLTDRPTAFMMSTKFTNVIVLKIGNQRRLAKPLKPVQLKYLSALGLKSNVYTEP